MNMSIYANGELLKYEYMMFPDGQPHVKLERLPVVEKVFISTPLVTPLDFIELLLVKDILDQGDNEVHLFITYMSGARMDRTIDDTQPFTLGVYADLITRACFDSVAVLDPHSKVTPTLLSAKAVYPIQIATKMLMFPRFDGAMVVIPDDGAVDRVNTILRGVYDITGKAFPGTQGHKKRDPQTGALSGFSLEHPEDVAGKNCLIMDDICDGGGTFTGLSKVLREAGATRVDLFVTHGVFSKGLVLQGIDHIFTTDSYFKWVSKPNFTVFPLGDLKRYALLSEAAA